MSIQSGDSLADHYESFLERLDDIIDDYLNVVPEDHDPVHNMSGLHAWRAKVRKGMMDRRKTGSVASSDSIQSDIMHVQQESSAETTSNQATSAVHPPRVTQQDAPQGSGETCSNSSRENSVDIMMNELDRSIRKEEELGLCLLGDVFDDEVPDFGDGYGAEPMNVADVMHLAANNLTRDGHPAEEAHFEEEHSSQQVNIEAEQQEAAWDSSRIQLQQDAWRLPDDFSARVPRLLLERVVDEDDARLLAARTGFCDRHDVVEPGHAGLQQHQLFLRAAALGDVAEAEHLAEGFAQQLLRAVFIVVQLGRVGFGVTYAVIRSCALGGPVLVTTPA